MCSMFDHYNDIDLVSSILERAIEYDRSMTLGLPVGLSFAKAYNSSMRVETRDSYHPAN
jgi:hypothetical protein